MVTTLECPNCGATIQDDGVSETVHCRFCGSNVVIPRTRRAASRKQLELEREQILNRDREWDRRFADANARGASDYIVPPAGCCGIYVLCFVVGSLILGTLGLQESKQHELTVATIAICSALGGFVLILLYREQKRRTRFAALERDRAAERTARDARLREIERELASLG